MSSRRALVIAGTAALAGCGNGDAGESPKPKAAAPPAELQGTYTVRLKPGDLPTGKDAPPEFKPENKPYAWRVEISDSGGPDNGPTLNIVSLAHGSLESPRLTVAGDKLRLSDEECASDTGYTFVSTTYRWVVIGPALRLTKLSGGCPDKVAETILTSRALTKVAG